MAKISILYKERFDSLPTIISTNPDINRILQSMGFDQVFYIVKELVSHLEYLDELPQKTVDESEMKQRVIEAHRLLMSLNENNREAFQDLVQNLEEN